MTSLPPFNLSIGWQNCFGFNFQEIHAVFAYQDFSLHATELSFKTYHIRTHVITIVTT